MKIPGKNKVVSQQVAATRLDGPTYFRLGLLHPIQQALAQTATCGLLVYCNVHNFLCVEAIWFNGGSHARAAGCANDAWLPMKEEVPTRLCQEYLGAATSVNAQTIDDR